MEADLYPWWHRDHDASFFVVATADAGAGTDGTGAADEAGLDGGDALAAEDGDWEGGRDAGGADEAGGGGDGVALGWPAQATSAQRLPANRSNVISTR